MAKPLTVGEKIARDLCEMDAPIDNIIEVDPVDVARRIDEEVFSILDSLADCAFRNERLVSDYASIQEELSTIRRIHVQNIAIKDAEIARWKTVPMKHRRPSCNRSCSSSSYWRADEMTKVQRYKVGYYTDEWGMSSNTPCLVPDDSGYAVKFEDCCKLETELSALKEENATAWAQAHRLALELECLLLDTKDNAIVSKWWDYGMAALNEYQQLKPGAKEDAEAWAKIRKETL